MTTYAEIILFKYYSRYTKCFAWNFACMNTFGVTLANMPHKIDIITLTS